jgi:cysteine desulfurase
MPIKKVYLDNSATTRVDDAVVQTMLSFFTEAFGNASSTHQWGQHAKQAVETARHQVAQLINAQPSEITFLSGGTESDNLAIKGIAETHGGLPANLSGSVQAGGVQARRGKHVITSQIEHPAVLASCAELEKRGWRVTRLPVYHEGIVRLSDVKAALSDDTVLVTIMHSNNEIGTLQPLAEIAALIKERRAAGQKHLYLHTDAVQSIGKTPVDVQALGVDLLSLTAHKFHGPKGIGVLYVRKGVRLAAQMHGGHHERDRRAGTESVPLIAGIGQAAELARIHLNERMEQLRGLRDYLETGLLETIPDISRNGDAVRRLPHIANFNFEHVEGEGLQISLDLKGIAVSTGSACASGSVEPSHVLVALGLDQDNGRGALRFSLGKDNTKEEVDYVLATLPPLVEKLRKLSPKRGERG